MAERRWHTLPDGVKLELLFLAAGSAPAARTGEIDGFEARKTTGPAVQALAGGVSQAALPPPPPLLPPLLFVHGSFHGAWCWEDHFLPYFASQGYNCFAVSLRSHGGSEAGPGPHAGGAVGTLQSHADDLASLIATLPRPPVLVVHSLAGLIAAKYVSRWAGGSGYPPLAGLALLAATPPSGNSSIAKRTARRSFVQVARIAWSFIRRSYRTSPAACRFLFFSPHLPAEALQRHAARLAAGPTLTLINSRQAVPDNTVPEAPPTPAGWPCLPGGRVFVGCGSADVLVDVAAGEEAAAFFGAAGPVVWEGVAHDCMLDAGWQEVAHSLHRWLAEWEPRSQ